MKTIIYISNYLSDKIMEERDNKEFYSPAANNKILAISKTLVKAGYKVCIVSPCLMKNNSFKVFEEKKENIEENMDIIYVEGLDCNFLNRFYSVFEQVKIIKKLRTVEDICGILFYDFFIESSFSAIISKYLFKIRIFADYEEELFTKDYPTSIYRLLLLFTRRFVAKRINGAIIVTSKLTKFLQTKNVFVCRGFYTEFNEPINLNNNLKPVITYSGKMDSYRGLDILLDALGKIKFKCKLCITGYGSLEKRIKEIVENSVFNNVTIDYKGFIAKKEYEELILSSDILINTQLINKESSHYLFPSKVIEYMSTGKIVISSNISDIEIISNEKVVLYNSDSPDEIARVINTVLENLNYYKAYGINAKKYAKEKFGEDTYVKEFFCQGNNITLPLNLKKEQTL